MFPFVLLFFSCKEDPVRVYSKDFSLRLTLPESYKQSMVGSEVPLTLEINEFSQDNDGEIQTLFSTNSSGTLHFGDKEIPQGSVYAYDYRSKKMTLDFTYSPSSDGEKTIEVEVRCKGVVRKASVKITAVSPETAMTFNIPETTIIPEAPVSIPFNLYTNNEELTLKAIFVKGSGKVELDGKLLSGSEPLKIRSGSNRLVCTFSKAGEQVIDFILKGRYGDPQKTTLTLNVGVPEWAFTVEKMNPDQRIELNRNHSFIFKINANAEGNEFSCKYRLLSGQASLSFNGVEATPSQAFKVGAGSSIALINPSSVGKIEIEFVVTDKFGVERKDTAVFYTLGSLSMSVTPQTQRVMIGDEARVVVKIAEDNYRESFTMKFERLLPTQGYELISTRTVSSGTHEFLYTPKDTGGVTFRVTVSDKHGQSAYEIFTLDARSQNIVVTAPKLEYSDDIHQPVNFEINVSEKGYNGRFWLYWDIDHNDAELKSVDRDIEQEIAPRNYTEVTNGKNRFKFTPHFVGSYPIKFTIKDERNQTINYSALRFTSSASITALATRGGRAEGSKKTADGIQPQSITAIPQEGYDFVHWYQTDKPRFPISTSKTYSFVVKDNVSYTAVFRIKEFIIKAVAGSGGRVALEGHTALHRSLEYGSQATVVATPSAGYDFEGWFIKGNKVSTQLRHQFTVHEATTLEARFTLQKKNLNISTMTGGSVRYGSAIQRSHQASLDYGTMVDLLAIPEETYAFAGWYEGSLLVSSSASYSFNIEKHTNLEARFRKQIYKISVRSNLKEAGRPEVLSGKSQYNHGEEVTVVANRDTFHERGYKFLGWYVGDELLSRNERYTFNMVRDIPLESRYKAQEYEITYRYRTDGEHEAPEIDVNGQSLYNGQSLKIHYGDNLNIHARIGGHWREWTLEASGLRNVSRDNQTSVRGVCRNDIIIYLYKNE